jgi:hypothetical protein
MQLLWCTVVCTCLQLGVRASDHTASREAQLGVEIVGDIGVRSELAAVPLRFFNIFWRPIVPSYTRRSV